jgi:hypothetical protein
MFGNKTERLIIKQLYEIEEEIGGNNGMKHQQLYYFLILELFLDVIFYC